MAEHSVHHRKKFYLFMAFVQVGLFAGTTYGWTNLKECLQRDGVYAGNANENRKYDLIFTVGAWLNQGGRFVLGFLLDRYGVKMATVVSCVLCLIGGLMVAMSNIPEGKTDLLLPGFAILSFGGPGLQISLQTVSNLFVNRGAVISVLIWGFQISYAPYLILNELTKKDLINRQPYLYFYAGIAGLFALVNPFLWPKRFEKRSEEVLLLQTEELKQRVKKGRQTMLTPALGFEENYLETASLWQMFTSHVFLELNIWFGVFVLVLQFYMGSIGDQTKNLVGDNMSAEFGILSVAVGFLAVLPGYLLDKLGFTFLLFLLTCLCTAFCLIMLVDNKPLQWVGFAVYITARVTCYSFYFSFLAINFGTRHFGMLCGIGLLTSSLVSLIQYPMFATVDDNFDGSFKPIMFIQAISIFVFGLLCTLRIGMLERVVYRATVDAGVNGVVHHNTKLL